jgi:hypothetical protein
MTPRRTVACLLLLVLALVPALGLAADDLSAPLVSKHQHVRLQHQPQRAWRTTPTTLTVPPPTPVLTARARLITLDAPVAVPVVVHLPFVPPRS